MIELLGMVTTLFGIGMVVGAIITYFACKGGDDDGIAY